MGCPKYLPAPPLDHHHHHLHPPAKPHEEYVVLPSYYPPGINRRCPINLHTFFLLLGLFSLSFYLLWPSDPELRIVELKLKHLKVHRRPHVSVDVSMATTFEVSNRDAFSVDFEGLNVAVRYRGKELGNVTTGEGHLRPWGSSHVDALVEFKGVKVHDWLHLLQDLLNGTVPFDAESSFNGRLGLYFFQIPLKANVSCDIDVNVKNQTIKHQSCYREPENSRG